MTTVKGLAIVALLFGGTSFALAQTPPTAGPNPPANVTGSPTGAPAYTSGPNLKSPSASHRGTRHHRMYMSAKSPHHHKTMKTGQPQPKQPQ